jgi:hypothetical protein
MCSKVSTAGIRLTDKRGLLDSCPRRFETKEEAELIAEAQKSVPKPASDTKKNQQPNNN